LIMVNDMSATLVSSTTLTTTKTSTATTASGSIYTTYVTSWYEIRSIFREKWVTTVIYLTLNYEVNTLMNSKVVPTSFLLTSYLSAITTVLVNVTQSVSPSSTGSSV